MPPYVPVTEILPEPTKQGSGFSWQGIRLALEVGAFQNVGVLRFYKGCSNTMVYSFSQQIFIEHPQSARRCGYTCEHTGSLPSQGSHSKGGRQSTGDQPTGEKEVRSGVRPH